MNEDDGKLRTLKEWNSLGRWIKKGEKKQQLNEAGVAVFSFDQTWLPKTSRKTKDDTLPAKSGKGRQQAIQGTIDEIPDRDYDDNDDDIPF